VEACTKSLPMLNSVNGNASRMDAIFPIAAEHEAPLIALPVDESGIPKTSGDRVDVCRKMMERANKAGIPPERMYFDPLVVPISTGERQGRITLDTLAAIKGGINGAKTVVGLSNVSHGLPCRSLINGVFLSVAIGFGLDAAILNPNDDKLMSHIRAAEVVAGKDRRCRRYTQAHSRGLLIG
jgi:5-methyltetrahydrofolate--homocysteine methyltransferase